MMVDLSLCLLSWGRRKLGTKTILGLGLLMGIMTSIVIGLTEGVTGLETHGAWLWFLSFLGAVTGWWLCRKGMSLWLGAAISFLVGFVLLLIYSGSLLPYLWSLARAGFLILWMQLFENSVSQPAVSAMALIWGEFVNALNLILNPLRAWLVAFWSGRAEYNEIVTVFIWSMLVWLLAIWGSWGIRRYENPILAALPSGMVLGASLAYVDGDAKALILFFACVLLFLSLTSHALKERRWGILPLPFSEELRFDVGTWSVLITLSLMLVALLLPNLSIRKVVSWIKSSGGQAPQSEGLVDPVSFGDSLGLLPKSASIPVSMFDGVRTPGLPREHLLGSGPELGEQIVMVVSVEDPMPQEMRRYYWKSLTYDRYNGRGWETGETREIRYSEGQAVFSETAVNHRVIRQTISSSERLGGLVYAYGTLLSANRDYVVAWRGSGDEQLDLFGAMLRDTRYQVDSAIPTYSASQLREAGGDIPSWVREGYLVLPDKLPDRVVQLARQLVQNQSNSYDKALAIERYLRTYPYNLAITLPPAGEDVVDYFLFDLRQGYCDYYATAMVVLARLAGLPARLAVGYASGLYDQANQRYIVTAADAHSWVEIYFPEFGWIPFEPTAGQPSLEREELPPEITPSLDGEFSPFPSKWARLVRWGSIILGAGLALLVTGFVIWWEADLWLLRRRPPEEAIRTIFQRIYRFGWRLGFATASRLTPYEYSTGLNNHMAGLISHLGQKPESNPLFACLREITDIYVKSVYGPNAPNARVRKEAVSIWKSLRSQFWWLWLRSRIGI